MNTDTTLEILSIDSAHTEKIGEHIGRHLRGGEVIELQSDVGGGKTTFMRGLVRGAGSKDLVASPTFTISKEYAAPAFTIHHLDLYRLGENPGIVRQELAEFLESSADVVAIEWANSLTDVLPKRRLTIQFAHRPNDQRIIYLTVPKQLRYLLEEIQT
jgi:tRNA threonylcarbamoyladenosine biosynthesis protein TsaE